MAVSGVIKIEGLPGLVKKLGELAGDKVAKKAMRSALREASKPIAAKAKSLAPVHDGPYPEGRLDREPGSLRKSIKVKAIRRTRKGIGVRVATSDQDSAFKGKQFYGAFLEYGTANVVARPYMRPAFDTQKAIATHIIERRMVQAINDASSGGAS